VGESGGSNNIALTYSGITHGNAGPINQNKWEYIKYKYKIGRDYIPSWGAYLYDPRIGVDGFPGLWQRPEITIKIG